MRILFYYNGEENIGVESLSAYVKSQGHETDLIYDPGFGNNFYMNLPLLNSFVTEEMLVKKARRYRPGLIAMSFITNQYQTVLRMARKLKKAMPEVPIVVGGIHATSMTGRVLQEDCFDMAIRGEGEQALAELAACLEKGEDYRSIQNLAYRGDDRQVQIKPMRPLMKDLDAIPWPDKSIFAQYRVVTRRPYVMTGRGCPYRCTFCVNSYRKSLYPGQRYLRKRSPENVIAELKEIKRLYKAKFIRFIDDVFAYDLNWLRAFRRLYVDQINLPFDCNITPNNAREEIIEELALAGCKYVYMGVQSGDPDLRETMLKRRYTNEEIIRAARLIRKYRMKLITEFIFGFPGETLEQMRASIDLNEELKATYIGTFIFYPFPNTELADHCLQNNYLSQENAEKVANGLGSMHTLSFIDHPHKAIVYSINAVLPFYNVAPRMLRPWLRRLMFRPYGWRHKMINFLSLFSRDFWDVLDHIFKMPRVIWQARRVLKR